MTERIRVLFVGCVAAVSLMSLMPAAQSMEGAPASAVDSLAGVAIGSAAGHDSVAGLVTDDSAAAPPGAMDSLPGALDLSAVPVAADDPAALAAWLDRLGNAGARLPQSDQFVFAELVAAAREMLQTGDSEATRLLAADALAMLRQEAP